MTKEVLVSICGLHTVTEESDAIIVEVPASYYKKDNKHYIFYEEAAEEFSGTIKNTIKAEEDKIIVSRKGTTDVDLVFSRKQKSKARYSTPLGDMAIGIWTKEIQIEETAKQLRIVIDYMLEIEDVPVTDCKITICCKENVVQAT